MGRYATGFTLKDSDLNKKAEGGSKIGPPRTVMNAEIQAIINGLQCWFRNTQGTVKVFLDSLEAVQAINSKKVYHGIEEDNINMARMLIRDPSVLGVYYYPRLANKEAHLLAKSHCEFAHSLDWMEHDLSF